MGGSDDGVINKGRDKRTVLASVGLRLWRGRVGNLGGQEGRIVTVRFV